MGKDYIPTGKPVGRPTGYREEYCEAVIDLGRAGKSITQIACALDINKSQLYDWEKMFPEFGNALARARQEAQCWWEDKGQTGLDADKFQASLWAKQVSCRFPDDYRDKTEKHITGNLTLGTVLEELDGRSKDLPSN